jgi:hypothetical protein
MIKLPAEASRWLPAPVEKAIINYAAKQINDRSVWLFVCGKET